MGFFLNGDFPSRICCDFFRTALFPEKLLLQNSYFFGASTFFLTSSFFRTVNSLRQLFFQSSHFFRGKKHHLKTGSSLVAKVLFGTAAFLAKELFRMKISTELIRNRYFCKPSTISEELHFGKEQIFQKSNIPDYPFFSGELLFRAATFSKDIVFYGSYLFRRVTYLQHTFSDELTFHSYASFPQLHFLFIS